MRITCDEVTPTDTAPGWRISVHIRDNATPEGWLAAGRLLEQIEILAVAYRLVARSSDPDSADQGWQMLANGHWIVA